MFLQVDFDQVVFSCSCSSDLVSDVVINTETTVALRDQFTAVSDENHLHDTTRVLQTQLLPGGTLKSDEPHLDLDAFSAL